MHLGALAPGPFASLLSRRFLSVGLVVPSNSS